MTKIQINKNKVVVVAEFVMGGGKTSMFVVVAEFVMGEGWL